MSGHALPAWWTDTVTVHRAPLTGDRYGDQVRDWTAATTHALERVLVNPVDPGTEFSGTADDRAQLTRRRVLAAPITSDLLESDRVEWQGDLYEVEGEPVPWRSPLGGVDHLYAQLVRVEG